MLQNFKLFLAASGSAHLILAESNEEYYIRAFYTQYGSKVIDTHTFNTKKYWTDALTPIDVDNVNIIPNIEVQSAVLKLINWKQNIYICKKYNIYIDFGMLYDTGISICLDYHNHKSAVPVNLTDCLHVDLIANKQYQLLNESEQNNILQLLLNPETTQLAIQLLQL